MKSLFSFVTTLYALLLFYSPSIFYPLFLSPVPLSTLLLLLNLLRLGAAQRSTINPTHSDSTQPLPKQSDELFRDEREPDESRAHFPSHGPNQKQDTSQLYAEWDLRAPLVVIYEEYEGEDAVAENYDSESQMDSIRRYASLSLFYPESDSDTWSEEDDREGLIEIPLDQKRSWEVEEDNLIEIDLSPTWI